MAGYTCGCQLGYTGFNCDLSMGLLVITKWLIILKIGYAGLNLVIDGLSVMWLNIYQCY